MDVKISPVSPCDADALLIFGWRNDPITCQNSINPNPKIWDQFYKEFYCTYFKNVSLFAELNGRRVGLIYFTNLENVSVSEVGINLDPVFRGQGISRPILQKAIAYFQVREPHVRILQAKIKTLNLPSIRLFKSLGFVEIFEKIPLFENRASVMENHREIRIFQLSLVKPEIAISPRSSELTVSAPIE